MSGTIQLEVPLHLQVCVLAQRPKFRAPALEAQSTTPVPPRLPSVLVAPCSYQYLRPVPIPIASAPRRLALAMLQAAVPAVPAQVQAITGTIQMEGPLPLQVRVLV